MSEEQTQKSSTFMQTFREAKATLKKDGLKGLWRRYGWRIFAVIFFYYLIRDSILYILIPWLVARHFL